MKYIFKVTNNRVIAHKSLINQYYLSADICPLLEIISEMIKNPEDFRMVHPGLTLYIVFNGEVIPVLFVSYNGKGSLWNVMTGFLAIEDGDAIFTDRNEAVDEFNKNNKADYIKFSDQGATPIWQIFLLTQDSKGNIVDFSATSFSSYDLARAKYNSWLEDDKKNFDEVHVLGNMAHTYKNGEKTTFCSLKKDFLYNHI